MRSASHQKAEQTTPWIQIVACLVGQGAAILAFAIVVNTKFVSLDTEAYKFDAGCYNESINSQIEQWICCPTNDQGTRWMGANECAYTYLDPLSNGIIYAENRTFWYQWDDVTEKPWFAVFGFAAMMATCWFLLLVAWQGAKIGWMAYHQKWAPLSCFQQAIWFLALLLPAPLWIVAYCDYQTAPDLRVCSPPPRLNLWQHGKNVVDTYDDILGGGYSAPLRSTNATERQTALGIKTAIDEDECEFAFYQVVSFDDAWNLTLSVALTSSEELANMLGRQRLGCTVLLFVYSVSVIFAGIPLLKQRKRVTAALQCPLWLRGRENRYQLIQ